ncbi:uncharacterized protein C8Q71DRAFT_126738 [Rhodofomes roseus]|uniref:Secreted protein n=1 Tax=Rhodofomes roseus TaxID=34475 RepID=A0ABQ8KB90_9APHY|nr:uncharacterized protein C8Q71DRAFT_126738 [Rhodofomes roseus]KAH9834831.1 hypothetical protein C8Q71DRAFT_126738 [Rhodofomes roseus]
MCQRNLSARRWFSESSLFLAIVLGYRAKAGNRCRMLPLVANATGSRAVLRGRDGSIERVAQRDATNRQDVRVQHSNDFRTGVRPTQDSSTKWIIAHSSSPVATSVYCAHGARKRPGTKCGDDIAMPQNHKDCSSRNGQGRHPCIRCLYHVRPCR